MIDVMVSGFPWYLHPPSISAGPRPEIGVRVCSPGPKPTYSWAVGLSSKQSSSCSTWAISIVAGGASAAKSVAGLTSNRHDALTERVFRLVPRVSAWRFIAARA
jgi:hypothetical protein